MVCPAGIGPHSSYPAKAQGCAAHIMWPSSPCHATRIPWHGVNFAGKSHRRQLPLGTGDHTTCVSLSLSSSEAAHLYVTTLLFGTRDEEQRWLLLITSCKSSKDQSVSNGPDGWDLCRVLCPDWRSS